LQVSGSRSREFKSPLPDHFLSNVIKRLQWFVTVKLDVFLREIPEGDPLANNESSLCLCSPFIKFLLCVPDQRPDCLSVLLSASIVVEPKDCSTLANVFKDSRLNRFQILTHSNHLSFNSVSS